MSKIAIIGAGNMGSAIAAGLDGSNYNVVLTNRSEAKLQTFAAKHPAITVTTDNTAAVNDADIVIVAVSMACFDTTVSKVLVEMKPEALLVTMAPGKSFADIPSHDGIYLARIMPNIAITKQQSMTFVAFDSDVKDEVKTSLIDLLDLLGETAVVEQRMFSAATALCSCGLAYAFRYIRAAAEGAVAMGFEPDDAVRYICATLRGAAAMLEDNCHPEQMIDKVTTPGGMTIRGLLAMEQNGFSNAVVQGLLTSYHE